LSVSTENKFKTELEELRKTSKEQKEKFKQETEEREKMHNDFMAQILDRIAALEAKGKSGKK
jgi:hypothetical protein